MQWHKRYKSQTQKQILKQYCMLSFFGNNSKMLRYTSLAFVLYFISCNLCLLVAVPHAATSTTTTTTTAKPVPSYDTKFDNVDLDEVLHQERLLKNYVNCLENKGPCTPDGKMLKDTLPDAISTDCAKCSERQKYGSDKVTRFLIDNRPEDWARLEKIYDPSGKYRQEYLAEKEKAEAAENANEAMQAS